MRKWLRMGGAACVLAFVAVTAGAQERKDDEKPLTDAEFVKKFGSGNLHEIELGKIAKERAADPDVKKFAERMVTDHTKALEELKTAAKDSGNQVPMKMDPEHQKHVDMMRDHKGPDFDKLYMKHMVEDHEKTLKMLTRAGKELKDEKLKALAEKSRPIVQDHLDMARKISERLDK